MKFQLALDDITMEEAVELLEKLEGQVDIIEVGTPFMMVYGMEAVRTLKGKYPQCEVLCDAKIMDAGGYEAKLCFEAGADYVTVLGVTDILTIKDCVKTAGEYKKKIVVDMICVDDFEKRISEVEGAGADIIAVHTGVDQQTAGRTPLDDLIEMRKYVKSCQIAVAGGIGSTTVEQYLPHKPDIVIAGGSVVKAENPSLEARRIIEKMKGGNRR